MIELQTCISVVLEKVVAVVHYGIFTTLGQVTRRPVIAITRRTGALDWLWASYMAEGGTSRSLRVKFAVYSAWSESPSRVVSCSRAEEGQEGAVCLIAIAGTRAGCL